jgi:uncharacterized protein (TIGR03435 family)
MRVRLLIAILGGLSLAAQGLPKFAVASIRVHSFAVPDRGGPPINGNQFTIRANFNQLVIYAYDLKVYQISGGPNWVTHPSTDGDYYDISAKAEDGEALTEARARLMLQALLTDRFKLELHRETKEMPIYALTATRNGLKLKENERDMGCSSLGSVNQATVLSTFTHCPMDALVRVLSGAADRPVIDRTGLTGSYDFKVAFARDPAAAIAESNAASLFTALQELGLKLEAQKGNVEILMIDRAERPSDN